MWPLRKRAVDAFFPGCVLLPIWAYYSAQIILFGASLRQAEAQPDAAGGRHG